MKMVEAWKKVVLEDYATFTGRAGLGEYWWFALASLVIGVVFAILGEVSSLFSLLSVLYSLAVLVPSLAVAARRLHDTNRTGWWLLIGLVPVVGVIVLIVFLASRGTDGTNDYGPVPPSL